MRETIKQKKACEENAQVIIDSLLYTKPPDQLKRPDINILRITKRHARLTTQNSVYLRKVTTYQSQQCLKPQQHGVLVEPCFYMAMTTALHDTIARNPGLPMINAKNTSESKKLKATTVSQTKRNTPDAQLVIKQITQRKGVNINVLNKCATTKHLRKVGKQERTHTSHRTNLKKASVVPTSMA